MYYLYDLYIYIIYKVIFSLYLCKKYTFSDRHNNGPIFSCARDF